MADDIVQELHDWATITDEVQGKATLVMLSGRVFADAAAEIERLRSENERLTDALNNARTGAALLRCERLEHAGDALARAIEREPRLLLLDGFDSALRAWESVR